MIISIIIINYNSKSVLLDCLKSVVTNIRNQEFELLVIDNNSSEDIKDLETLFPRFSFIYNQKNLGFAAANNIGIRKSAGKYVLLLNPDTIVNENSFDPMIKYLDDHKDVGVVGCKIFNQNGEIERSTHSFPSLTKEFVHANEFIKKLFGYESKIVSLIKNLLKLKSFESYWDHNMIKEVDHVTGACMMVKKEAIDKAGLLDEAFFLYNEEVEWSYRIKKAGYKSVFVPDSNIMHIFGYSTKQRIQTQTINALLVERYRGMFYYFQKHYGLLKLFALRLIVLQGFGFRLVFLYLNLFNTSKHHKETSQDKIKYIKNILALIWSDNFDWRLNL